MFPPFSTISTFAATDVRAWGARRRTRGQTQMPRDHGRPPDGGDDLRRAATVRAMRHVDVEDTRLIKRVQPMRAGRCGCSSAGSRDFSTVPGTIAVRSLGMGPRSPVRDEGCASAALS
jgi:hypothetical protein